MEKINFVNNSEPYLSAENLNQMQDNIEEAIGEHYSTEETFTGKYWIDGKKIYRKVLETGACSLSTTNISFDTGIINISNITDINFMYKYGAIWYKIWNIKEIGYDVSKNVVYVSTTSNASFSDSFIILEYTKTTD